MDSSLVTLARMADQLHREIRRTASMDEARVEAR